MKPIDFTILSTASIVYYNTPEIEYEEFSKKQEFCVKLAEMQNNQEKQNEEGNDDIKITGRTILHICQAIQSYFNRHRPETFPEDILKSIIKDNYFPDINYTFDELDDLIESFNTKPNVEEVQKLIDLTSKSESQSESET